MIFQRADWMERAACRGMDPELFHPARGEHYRRDRAIRAVCAECPVIEPCREMGIADYSLRGYWGGLSWNERQAIRQERARIRVRVERAERAFRLLRGSA